MVCDDAQNDILEKRQGSDFKAVLLVRNVARLAEGSKQWAPRHTTASFTQRARATPRFDHIQYEGAAKSGSEVLDVSCSVCQCDDSVFEYVSTETGMSNLDLLRTDQPPI